MTKILRLYFLFSLISSTAFGQTQALILTRNQNTKWLDTLKVLVLDQQLAIIRDRLLADTNVFVRQLYSDRIRIVDSIENRVYGDGKPMFIIGKKPMIIDNKTKPSQIIGLAKLLNNDFIKRITILSPDDPATIAIYGLAGMSGLIFITLTKKKYLKSFGRLNLRPKY